MLQNNLPETNSDECADPVPSESIGMMSVTVVDSVESPSELQRQLDRERGIRVVLEEQVRQLEDQLYHHTQLYQLSNTEEPEDISLQVVTVDSIPAVTHTQTVVCSPHVSPCPSPEPPEQKLPSVLEAAIKAEPKVEVERLPSPNDDSAPSRIYVANTSRQNLETIVEAIRHLEGDHMFAEEPNHPGRAQDMPLALTTRTSDRLLKLEMNQFLEFPSTTAIQLQQQSRPGVIVVKQAS